ncbi:hypothetical protein ACIGGE_12245 [Qipengyuania sp. NPDC077410]|uniref:hypothetical protein n=1 Tax=Qipengyuania sp. NPDC077410 TaxID=3364496 RepID=UPI0037C7E25A
MASGGEVPSWASDWNGFRVAEETLDTLTAVEQNGEVVLRVPQQARTKASDAYSREPLASDAIAVLGIASAERSNAILEKSRELDKRNQAVAAVLLQRAAENEDTPKMLELVDTFARINPRATNDIIGALSATLNDPVSYSVIEHALSQNPVWEEAFWRKVPPEPQLAAFYNLRMRERSPRTTEEADTALLRALIAESRFPDAFAFQKRIPNRSVSKGVQSLAWQLKTGGQVSADMRLDKTIAAYIQPGAGGELGRQLHNLEPGSYEIAASIEEQRGDGDLSLDLKCAAPDEPQASKTVALEDLPVRVQVGATTCPIWWVVLNGSAWNSSVPFRAIIKQPTFRPIER